MLNGMTPQLVAMLLSGVGGAGWQLVCRRTPEPVATPERPSTGRTRDEPKVPYRSLAGPIPTLVIAALAAAAAWAVTSHLPGVLWPVWGVVVTFGLWQAGVDAATTWIPKGLAHVTWVALGVAVAGMWWFSASAALWALVGAVVTSGVFALVWVLSRGGFGFGDVRFAPLLGAAGIGLWHGMGIVVVVWAGMALTAVWIVVDRQVTGLRRITPWVPGLWLALVGAVFLA